jgi:hypothetical protein
MAAGSIYRQSCVLEKKEKKRERAIITVLGIYTGSHQQVIEEIYTV